MTCKKLNPHAMTLVALLLSWLSLTLAMPTSVQAQDPAKLMPAVGGPDIVIWYGDVQTFGQQGVPQRWVNVMGNVSDVDGVDSLYYTLNGGSKVMLTKGPDGKRLQSSGDFNVDLATNDLTDGVNEVIVAATDNLNNRTEDTVTVNYTSSNVWPLPYAIDWQGATPANEVSQAVDGHWEVTSEGLHTVTTGYDRLVAIGDTTWDDYEITVPVIIHSAGGGSGIGVLLRWMGHTDYPVSCTQPKCGYLPLGAICWYRGNRLEIYGNDGDILATQTRSLTLDTTYIFKARVETNPGVGGQYSFKVWKASEPEPAGWDLTAQEALSDPQNGSLMLISHHGDVTYGNLSVTAVPISITGVQALVHGGDTSATISWNTSAPASSQVAYGLTLAHELDTISDPTLLTSHSLDLSGLLQNTLYHYQITSVSAVFDTAVTADLTFATVASDIVSDDFHLPTLNTSLWTFVDPVGDCAYDLVGSNTADAWLNFQVPAGTEHQLWTSGLKVPHVRQSCNNTDFEVEAKFESPLTQQYQEQGILVRQDDDRFMRFEFFSNSTNTRVYVASFVSGSVTTHADVAIGTTGMAPLYLRVKRQTDQWTASYSTDGVTWSQAAIFTFALTVTGVGPYAGNAVGGSSPAHTGSIDYFFNTASPVTPEDPVSSGVVVITSTPVTTAVIGQSYTYDVDAAGTPAPTFSLLTAPAGMTIDAVTGLIEWTPGATGDFDVSVQASNPIPSADIQDFVIHVADTAGGAISDDFNTPTLNTAVWSFVDPLGGGGYTLTGTCTGDAWINISVPGGAPHELWTAGIMAPHILQPSGNTDFQLEVKFESSLSGAFQEQGILVKQDSANFLRFEFFSNASNTNVIAATLTGTAPPLTSAIKFTGSIGTPGIAPLYMRVNRTGNQWTQSYSFDGSAWTTAVSFAHTLVATAVGTYAGNAGSTPAHTSSVDYFFNNASPVTPEDPPCAGTYQLIVSTTAGGTITAPATSPVTVDDGVATTITAVADAGYTFAGWTVVSGSGVAIAAPSVLSTTATLTAGDAEVRANFTLDTYTITATAAANGSISPTGAVVVNHGASQAFTITPAGGYHVLDVLVDGGSVGAVASYTFTNVIANHTISATFEIDDPSNACVGHWALDEGSGGTMVDSSGSGNDAVITGSPSWVAGVHNLAMDMTAGEYGLAPDAPSLDITNAITIALWAKPVAQGTQYMVRKGQMDAEDGYELSLSSASSPFGPGIAFVRFNQATSSNTYRLNSVTMYPFDGATWVHLAATYDGDSIKIYVNGVQDNSVAATMTIATNNLPLGIGAQSNGTTGFAGQLDDVRLCNYALSAGEIAALAATVTHTITASAGPNGSIAPSGAVVVADGASQAFAITPNAGYHVLDVLVDGGSVGAVTSYTFTNVTANHTISATFAIDTWIITASAGANGSISPNGAVIVNNGASQAFSITPDGGYVVADVLVDGGSVGAVTSYTFTNVTADHTIAASFSAVTTFQTTFQEGLDGYVGTEDTYVLENDPTSAFGTADSAGWDGQEVTGTASAKYTLIRFDNIFGSGPGQIPAGALIQSATLFYEVYDVGDAGTVNEVLSAWTEATTFNSFGPTPGVQAEDYGTLVGSAPGAVGTGSVDVTSSLAAWVASPSLNKGWLFSPTGTNGVDLRSSEYATVSLRPRLVVDYDISNLAPDQPVLVSPADLATGVAQSPSLTVTVSDPETDAMTVTFWGRPTSGPPPNNFAVIGTNAGVASGASTAVVWPGLAPLTAYEWFVTVNDGVSTTTGPTWSFTTAGTPPGIVSTAVTAGVVGQAYSYDVDATGIPAPSYALLTAPAGMTINTASGLISWTPSAAGSFAVAVEASNPAGADTQSYSIEVAELPVITSTPVLNGAVGQVYSYDVDATGTPAPTYALVTFPTGMAINPVSGVISWTPTAIGDYAVSVQAINVAGSDTQNFSVHVDLLPPIPTLISPPDAAVITDDTPTFVWSSTAGAGGHYTLEYALDAAFSVGLVTVEPVPGTTYTVPAPLADNVYYWHVQAVDAASLESGYQVSPFSFTLGAVPPAVPTLLTPADQSITSDNTPTLTWSSTAGAGGSYTLQYGTDSLFGSAVTVSGLVGASYTIIIPVADGPYFWHVKAINSLALESGYQAVPFKFTVDASAPTVPMLLTPPNLSFTSETLPTFRWTAAQPVTTDEGRTGALAADASAAATYILQYSMDPTFTTATTVSGLPDTAYTVPGGSPLIVGTWYWHVESVDDGSNHSGFQPTPFQFGVFNAADVNGDGPVTSADIIWLVNYVFKGGSDPIPCKATGDVNCDGVVTSADIIYLVNYVFKGGPPPCNIGVLIESGTWDCP